MVVQNADLLRIAAHVLVADPAASTSQIAAAAGISRTTLHSRFPSRHALFVALADDAMDRIEEAYRDARLSDGTCREALQRAVERLVPHGATADLLLRERSLDDEERIVTRYLGLDDPLIDLVERGQRSGELRSDLPARWLADAFDGVLAAAWEQIAEGRLAPLDAPGYVTGIVLDGAVPR